jgi:phosphoadenosine phosphosulfate reductase
MALIDSDLFGVTHDKVSEAIQRIKEFEPPEGYWGATSFGKDSVTIMRLAKEAGVRVEWHHNLTTVDPPELIRFGRQCFPDVQIEKPPIPLLRLVETKGFPTSANRWCCAVYKERAGANRRILLGLRWEESDKRRERNFVEACFRDKSKIYVNPILDWTSQDVWDFHNSRKLPFCKLYSEGFDRIGCIMCPKASLKNRRREAERWPGMAKAWERAFLRLYENKKERKAFARWNNGYEMFGWWMSEQKRGGNPDQTVMFE